MLLVTKHPPFISSLPFQNPLIFCATQSSVHSRKYRVATIFISKNYQESELKERKSYECFVIIDERKKSVSYGSLRSYLKIVIIALKIVIQVFIHEISLQLFRSNF